MKVLFVASDFLCPDLALDIKNEGHDVAVALKEEVHVLDGTLKKIPYDTRFSYAKSCDLVVYDDKAKGEPSIFRKSGISVIGGGKKTDEIEMDRIKANDIAKTCGMLVPKIYKPKDLKDAQSFIQKTGGKWVLKQMGNLDGIKGLNGVAKMDNSEDLVGMIDWLLKRWPEGLKQEFVLQEKIDGHEFACGSYWNGIEFQKDKDGDELCEENWEHKPLMPGNMGEATGEMYTVLHYLKAKDSKLFKETLDKFRPLLKKIDFRGDFDINAIVNEKGVYFLEFTPRIGVPAISGQLAIQTSPWFDFLKAMADGKQVKDYKYNSGYCIVSWLLTKPFPAMSSQRIINMAEKMLGKSKKDEDVSELMSYKLADSDGLPIFFKEKLTTEDVKNMHFDGVLMDKGQLRVSNSDGYIFTITGMGKTVDEAADKVVALMDKIVVPKGFYRNDFKQSNYHKSKDDLIKWGYLKDETNLLNVLKK
jgi:phosphoribosylamine--glycine ligase